MASKLPLVLNNGQIEQLQAGDTLNASVTEKEVISLTAGTGGFTKGNPVYMSAADTAIKAQANAVGTTKVVGFALSTVSAAAASNVQTSGVVALTTGEWDAIAGTTGGLAFNTTYYLSGAAAGNIVSTAPASGYICELGVALSTTELLINIKPVIKL